MLPRTVRIAASLVVVAGLLYMLAAPSLQPPPTVKVNRSPVYSLVKMAVVLFATAAAELRWSGENATPAEFLAAAGPSIHERTCVLLC